MRLGVIERTHSDDVGVVSPAALVARFDVVIVASKLEASGVSGVAGRRPPPWNSVAARSLLLRLLS